MNHSVDDRMRRARREKLRWLVLYVLQQFSAGANEQSLGYMIGAAEGLEALSKPELRAALTYLHTAKLIELESGDHVMHWYAKLTRKGFDQAEHTEPSEPGIARPVKDW